MKLLKLSDGGSIPILGLGTWKSKAGEVETAVKAAIDGGYRHIDCAYAYGNEVEVGSAIKEKITDGTVKREDLFIVSKSGADKFPKNAQGEVLYEDVDIVENWKAMEACVDAGLTKSIGISNYNSQQTQRLLDEARIKPAVNQVEIHPYFSQEKLVRFCQERGVAVTAYSPLGSADRPWAPPGEPLLVEDPKIKAIAARYNKTSAQVILRWLTQRDIIVIPKSINPGRIAENLNVFDFEMSAEDMQAVSDINRDERLVVPKITVEGKQVLRDLAAPNFPFIIEF